MAWPDLSSLPADPATLSPNSLREFYENQRAVFLDLVSELGNDPGGSTTVQARIETLEAPIAMSTKTTSYTLALVDAFTVVEMNSASAQNITVPPNASVAFVTNTIIEVCRIGAGTVTLVAGAGVTLRSPDGALNLRVQWSSASLRKRATNEWVIAGDLA